MSDGAMILLGVIGIVLLILMIPCMRKEKTLVGFYKTIKVCGRWYTFFMADFLLVGAGCAIMLPVSLVLMFMGKLDALATAFGGTGMVFAIFAVTAVICLPIGIFMYRHAIKKCPENLRKGFLKDVIIMFFGTNLRIGFFFFTFLSFMHWWSYCRPTAYEVNGKTCYTYGNSDDLYDEYGNRVGTITDTGAAIMTDSRYK